METFDLIVLGAGPGGYPAAIRGAQLGAKVAIVEKESLGGTCLNWGCIPTKTLIASASVYHRALHGERVGVSAKPSFDYRAMWRRKNDVVTKLQGGIGQLLKANGVTQVPGTAVFEGRNRVRVTGKSDSVLEGRNIIVATGADSAVPGFLPKSPRIVESRAFLDRDALPASMIVMGGGVIGCEFACMAAELGCKVTVVEMLPEILAMLDADVRRELQRHMEKELGITVLTGAKLDDVNAGKDAVTARAGEKSISAELLLVAVGRRPNTAALNLSAAGIVPLPGGHIEVDSFCRTPSATVYAIGDVTAGSTQLAHAATAQGVAVAETALTGKRTAADRLVPAAIFTAPEIAYTGLTEAQAAAQGRKVHVGKFSFAGLGKAMAADEAHGFVKLIADATSDQLLGAAVIGPHATELISEATAAVRAELTAHELGRTIHCHPTLSEAWMEAAHAVHGTCIHAPPRRRA